MARKASPAAAGCGCILLGVSGVALFLGAIFAYTSVVAEQTWFLPGEAARFDPIAALYVNNRNRLWSANRSSPSRTEKLNSFHSLPASRVSEPGDSASTNGLML